MLHFVQYDPSGKGRLLRQRFFTSFRMTGKMQMVQKCLPLRQRLFASLRVTGKGFRKKLVVKAEILHSLRSFRMTKKNASDSEIYLPLRQRLFASLRVTGKNIRVTARDRLRALLSFSIVLIVFAKDIATPFVVLERVLASEGPHPFRKETLCPF